MDCIVCGGLEKSDTTERLSLSLYIDIYFLFTWNLVVLFANFHNSTCINWKFCEEE